MMLIDGHPYLKSLDPSLTMAALTHHSFKKKSTLTEARDTNSTYGFAMKREIELIAKQHQSLKYMHETQDNIQAWGIEPGTVSQRDLCDRVNTSNTSPQQSKIKASSEQIFETTK